MTSSTPSTMDAVLYVDEGPGLERRVLATRQGLAFRFEMKRIWSKDVRARIGDIYLARVKTLDAGGEGIFVDIGAQGDAYVRRKSGWSPSEGSLICVEIVAEAQGGKAPVATRADPPSGSRLPEAPELIVASRRDAFLSGVAVTESVTGIAAAEFADAAEDDILSPAAALPGGGGVCIEQTRAMVTVDVDAGGRRSGGDRSRFAMATNLEAGREIARRLSLKGMGGLVAIDFLKMKRPEDRRTAAAEFSEQLRLFYGRKNEVGEISRFGVLECAIARKQTPALEQLKSQSEVERAALRALGRLQRCAEQDRAAFLTLSVGPAVHEWLHSAYGDWSADLSARWGARFRLREQTDLAAGSEQVDFRQ